ncbi:hypothetical protein SY83_22095 [Paenibacillus swuensis]|uniref:DUF2642 domain-containing protein n=1 Tax=Paenibacillus swuensis TaxID=1178515 RepID=A0A172TNY4_9BACL|nr:hypothetical protein [Paenibacillus swuensis]ANE48527.1 hypothetical protein SY83_22095 [Paenibacillus swuensis]
MTEVTGVQPVLQGNTGMVETLKKMREDAYGVCAQCVGRPVQVETIHGETIQGTVANVDDHHLYLEVAQVDARGYYYNNVILPLVLYELLVISLLA